MLWVHSKLNRQGMSHTSIGLRYKKLIFYVVYSVLRDKFNLSWSDLEPWCPSIGQKHPVLLGGRQHCRAANENIALISDGINQQAQGC
jgi:hypothetical protein